MILVAVLSLITIITLRQKNRQIPLAGYTDNNTFEITWTLLPIIILAILSIPSFNALYSMENLAKPQITVKAIGIQ